MNESVQSIAIPFFTEEGWAAARNYMQDGNSFMASYADFVKRVAQFENDMRRDGHATVRVYIEKADFLDWCRLHGRKVDAKARSEYAAWKALHGNGNA